VIGTNTDIDHHKAMEAELEESRQRVTAAINAADIGLGILIRAREF
jgi:hypothetical protein